LADSPMAASYGVVLIDSNRSARRVAVLNEALSEATQRESQRDLEKHKVTDLYVYRQQEIEDTFTRFSKSVVFVVIDENELTTLKHGRLPRVPCESIACGYELIRSLGRRADVYFVIRRNVSGLDVLSMLLSGARGVVDRDVLGSSELIRMTVSTLMQSERERGIVAGHAAHVLDSLIQLIKEKHRMAKRHFALLVALAEIPRRRLDIGDRVTQIEVVNQIQRHFDATGYKVKLDTYRLLPTLLTIVKDGVSLEEDEDAESEDPDNSRFTLTRSQKQELAFLPAYAREFGLPAHVLPVRGIDEINLISHIYKYGVYGIETVTQRNAERIQILQVSLPRLHDRTRATRTAKGERNEGSRYSA
jgi:hypothetical protein